MRTAKDILQNESFEEKMKRIREGQALHTTERENIIIPNATQVPNQVFDIFMPSLSGAELKVLLYMIRKTFGYKKLEGDYIPMSQILNGTRKQDGTYQDRGTGLTKKTAITAVDNLEKAGLLKVERRRLNQDTNAINFYSLCLKV